jgi:hypothetical protein
MGSKKPIVTSDGSRPFSQLELGVLAVQAHPGFPSKDEEMKEQAKKTNINGALKQRYYEPLINWLWGYDFFISYHWESGGTYAVNLAAKLRDRGYDVFLDRSE